MLPRPIRAVLADDHRLVRQGLRFLLERSREVQVVGEADNGEEAILQVREKRPEVLLLDVGMPILDGIAVTRILSRRPDCPKILLLSSHEDDERIRAGMQAGAAGYVTKRVELMELIQIVKAAVSGRSLVSPYLANLGLEFNVARERVRLLTVKEREVLCLLVRGHANREIARQAHMSCDTVKAYLKSVFDKLQVRNRTQAAVSAMQAGVMEPAVPLPPGPSAPPAGPPASHPGIQNHRVYPNR